MVTSFTVLQQYNEMFNTAAKAISGDSFMMLALTLLKTPQEHFMLHPPTSEAEPDSLCYSLHKVPFWHWK